jgi:hypothetical protein
VCHHCRADGCKQLKKRPSARTAAVVREILGRAVDVTACAARRVSRTHTHCADCLPQAGSFVLYSTSLFSLASSERTAAVMSIGCD